MNRSELLENAKPIIFSTPMVQGILEDKKTQTRRIMKPQPVMDDDGMWYWKDCQWMDGGIGFPASGIVDHAPYMPGDILFVKETWSHDRSAADGDIYSFRADKENKSIIFPKWYPPIRMPREAARLFLSVKDVRVERLQDISEDDAKAEGIKSYWATKEAGEGADDWHESSGPPFIGADKSPEVALCSTRREAFGQLWDSLNAKRGYSWESNPWVWAYEFERMKEYENH